MIDHAYVQHPVWPRDQCEHRLDEEKDGAYGICGAPRSEHMDEVRVLKVQLATALRERDGEREFRGAAEAAFAEQLARTEAAESALAAARRECAEQSEAKEAAYSHIYKLRRALERCSELFSTIRGDWTDPRSECREGQDVIRKALAPPGAAAGEEGR